MSLEIKISLPVLAGILLTIVSLATAFYLYQSDTSLSYTYVLPLNTPQSAHLFFKQNTGIALIDVGKGLGYTTVFNGAFSSLILLPETSSYAVVVAKGVSIYVEAVNIIGTIIIVASIWMALRKTSGLKLVIISIVLLLLLISNILASLFYMNTGLNTGYRYNEKHVSTPISELGLTELENETFRYSYVLGDSINGLALVNISFQVRDPYIPLIIVRASNSQGTIDIPLEASIPGNGPLTYSNAFYIANSNLTIYVLSTGRLANTTLDYYKIEFQKIGDPPPLLVSLLPLTTLIATLVSCLLMLKITLRKP